MQLSVVNNFETELAFGEVIRAFPPRIAAGLRLHCQFPSVACQHIPSPLREFMRCSHKNLHSQQRLFRSSQALHTRASLNTFHRPQPNAFSFPLRQLERNRTRRPIFSHSQRQQHASRSQSQTLRSSYNSYIAALLLLCGSAYLFDSFVRVNPATTTASATPAHSTETSPTTSYDPFFTNMAIAPGHRGNLTADQEAKLRQLWVLTMQTFGVQDPAHPNGTAAVADDTPTNSEPETKEKKKKSRMSIFSSRKHDDQPSKAPTDDSDDKYGQEKEYHQIVSTQSAESLRTAFWSMVKADHPDALLLRFLRARKWDVHKALVMMISTMSWRGKEMHVDDDVMYNGELGALKDSKSNDANVAREGKDFLAQMEKGKSFLHGTDKEGRPICIVRARLHRGGDQTEKSMERYTVYVIETARLALRPPVETAVSRPKRHRPRTSKSSSTDHAHRQSSSI